VRKVRKERMKEGEKGRKGWGWRTKTFHHPFWRAGSLASEFVVAALYQGRKEGRKDIKE
jgi:hypothetical protein